MKVSEIMTSQPVYCRRETDLGAATELLWKGNCGFLPVVADSGRVIGAITDRDICIALGTKNRLPGEVSVAEIVPDTLASCSPNDDIRAALAAMGARKVHRLVVVNGKGELQGVLSLDDVVGKALKPRAEGGIRAEELAAALEQIVGHQVHYAPAQKAA